MTASIRLLSVPRDHSLITRKDRPALQTRGRRPISLCYGGLQNRDGGI